MSMFDRFFEKHPTFNSVSAPTIPNLGTLKDGIPAELITFWHEFGLGTFMEGYLKIVDPEDYHDFMVSSYSVFAEPAFVFGATAFADLLIWEKDCVKQINYRMGTTKIHGDSIAAFLNLRLARWDIVDFSMQGKLFQPAKDLLGECAFDECYAYVPALALGGSEKVENLQKVKLREHISILSQLVGVIE
jgi:hypothetical protein